NWRLHDDGSLPDIRTGGRSDLDDSCRLPGRAEQGGQTTGRNSGQRRRSRDEQPAGSHDPTEACEIEGFGRDGGRLCHRWLGVVEGRSNSFRRRGGMRNTRLSRPMAAWIATVVSRYHSSRTLWLNIPQNSMKTAKRSASDRASPA